jgi:hypothetical protein
METWQQISESALTAKGSIGTGDSSLAIEVKPQPI